MSIIAASNGAGYFMVAADGGTFSFGSAPFYGSLGGLPLRNPIVAGGRRTYVGNGYWFTDDTGLVSNFGYAEYDGSAPSPLNRPIVGMAEGPGNGAFEGDPYPPGAYGYDISVYQCGNLPTGDHQIAIVQVDGASAAANQPVPGRGGGVGGRRAQPLHLLDLRHLGHARAGMQRRPGLQRGVPGRHPRLRRRAGGRGGHVGLRGGSTWRADGDWSGNPGENVALIQGALTALHETEGVANVGIYASPGVWNSIVGDYQPDIPYWMADYLDPPSGPGSCADYQRWFAQQRLPFGPLEVVQYGSAQYDEDYSC